MSSKYLPYEPPTCAACKAWAPECLVPIGDGALPMCWLCAHQVTAHSVELEMAAHGECDCPPSAIYPAHVLERRLHRIDTVREDTVRRKSPKRP
jgi:hypothetical protein